MTIQMERDGKWEQIEPKDLTTGKLCELLSRITLDSDEFLSNSDIEEGYAAIREAMRRLEEQEEKQDEQKR